MEKEHPQKERLLNDYLHIIEIPVIGLGHDTTWIMKAARYLQIINLFLKLTVWEEIVS